MPRSENPNRAKPEVVTARIFEVWHLWLPLTVAMVMALIEGGWYTSVLAAVVAAGVLIALVLRLSRSKDEL